MCRLMLVFLLAAGVYNTAQADRTYRQLVDIQQVFHGVAEQVVPSVVHIEAILDNGKRRNKVSGSGFVWDDQGHIVTNEHVVSQARKVEVRFAASKQSVTAIVVGTDPQTDLAVLKVFRESNGKELVADFPPALPLAEDHAVQVGDWVLAVGNPYGLDGSVSFGIISAKARKIGRSGAMSPFLQTDAMIDFGSSGGPLVNLDAAVVGVNSMGQGRGIGFTIPIATAREVVSRLLTSGRFNRGWLGILMQPLDGKLAELWQLEAGGVLISQIVPDSPASKVLLQGDLITRVEGVRVTAQEDKDLVDVRRMIADRGEGAATEFTVLRRINDAAEWKEYSFLVTLGVAPPVKGALYKSRFGYTVEEATLSHRLNLGALDEHGLIVTQVEPGSPASEARLMLNDLIQSVHGNRVSNTTDLRLLEDDLEGRFIVQIWRSGSRVYLSVESFSLEQDN